MYTVLLNCLLLLFTATCIATPQSQVARVETTDSRPVKNISHQFGGVWDGCVMTGVIDTKVLARLTGLQVSDDVFWRKLTYQPATDPTPHDEETGF